MLNKSIPNDMEIDEEHNMGIVEGNKAADREKTIPIMEKKNKKTTDLDMMNKAGFPDYAESQYMDKKRSTDDNTDKNLLKNSDKKTETLITNFLTRRGKSSATRDTTLKTQH